MIDQSSPRPLAVRSAALAVLVVTLFSGENIARKALTHLLTPFGVNAISFSAAGLLICAGCLLRGIPLLPSTARLYGLHFVNGVCVSLVNICFQLSLTQVSAGWGNAISSAFPLFTLLTSALVLKEERLEPTGVLGIGVALAGLVLLTTDRLQFHGLGVLLLPGTVLLGIQICLVRRISSQVGAIQTIAWQQLLTGVICSVICLRGGFFVGVAVDASAALVVLIAALLYLVFAVNIGAFLLQAHLLESHAAATIASFFLLRPILGLVLGWLFLAEPISPSLLLSALLVGLGVLLIFQGDTLFPRLRGRQQR